MLWPDGRVCPLSTGEEFIPLTLVRERATGVGWPKSRLDNRQHSESPMLGTWRGFLIAIRHDSQSGMRQ